MVPFSSTRNQDFLQKWLSQSWHKVNAKTTLDHTVVPNARKYSKNVRDVLGEHISYLERASTNQLGTLRTSK